MLLASQGTQTTQKETRDSGSLWAEKAAERESEEPHVLLKYPCGPLPLTPSDLCQQDEVHIPQLGVQCFPDPNFFDLLFHCSPPASKYGHPNPSLCLTSHEEWLPLSMASALQPICTFLAQLRLTFPRCLP